jgi:hypothetical protein
MMTYRFVTLAVVGLFLSVSFLASSGVAAEKDGVMMKNGKMTMMQDGKDVTGMDLALAQDCLRQPADKLPVHRLSGAQIHDDNGLYVHGSRLTPFHTPFNRASQAQRQCRTAAFIHFSKPNS